MITYFVDPQSNISNLELGLKQHPFKSLDDPFRELFNNADGKFRNVKIFVKHNSNLTIHSVDMPLLALNINLTIEPYYDEDLSSNLINQTERHQLFLNHSYSKIRIYDKQYQRQFNSNFNPTIHTTSQQSAPYTYDFDLKISQGIFPLSQKSTTKLKFVTYNSNILVKYIHFDEITFQDASTNGLFVPTMSPFRWVNITDCYFTLKQMNFFVQDGSNIKIQNSVIDITDQSRIVQYASATDCQIYQNNHGMANNLIFDNNTFIGISQVGYTALIYGQNHLNFTLTNNKFINFQWIDSDVSFIIEHFGLNCNFKPFTQISIENNTIINNDISRMSYVYFVMTLDNTGKQNIYFRNNYFENFILKAPGILTITRGLAGTQNNDFNLIVKNITFSQVTNMYEQAQLMQINVPKVQITDINIFNFSEGNYGLIEIEDSQSITVANISFSAITFKNLNAFQIHQTNEIKVQNISIYNSQSSVTEVIEIFDAKNIEFNKITVSNLTRLDQSVSASLLRFNMIKPWAYAVQGQKKMLIDIQNFTLTNSQTKLLVIEYLEAEFNEQNSIIEEVLLLLLKNKMQLEDFRIAILPQIMRTMEGLIFAINSQQQVKIINCSIYENGINEQPQILQTLQQISEVNDQKLQNQSWYTQLSAQFDDRFVLFLIEKQNEVQASLLLEKLQTNPQIILIKASIQIGDNTTVQNQNFLLSSKSQSNIQINGLKYLMVNNSTNELIRIEQSEALIQNIVFEKIFGQDPLINALADSNIEILNGSYISSTGQLIEIEDSIFTMTLFQIYDVVQISKTHSLIQILRSQASFNGVTIRDIGHLNTTEFTQQNQMQPSLIALSRIYEDLKENSTFSNNMGTTGGAIKMLEISGKIQNSMFYNNSASVSKGGAIVFSCSKNNVQKCDLDLNSNSFNSNQAEQDGGALYYDLFQPQNLYTNQFQNNKAVYGKSVASYPFQFQQFDESYFSPFLGEETLTFLTFASGQKIKKPIVIAIYDQNNQIVNRIDNNQEQEGFGVLTTKDINLQISLNNKILGQDGFFNFTDLTLSIQPHTLTSLVFQSDQIDIEKYQIVTGQKYQGSNITMVNYGYWRTSNVSEIIHMCPFKDSCLGGLNSECSEGYQGKMCNTCSKEKVNGVFYARSGVNQCIQCEEIWLQILKFVGLLLWSLSYIFLKKKRIRTAFWRNVQVTVYVIVFLCYPILTNLAFALFSCDKIEDLGYFLKRDYSIQCWTGDHSLASLAIGLPVIFIWVLGFPAYIAFRIHRVKNKLDLKETIAHFGLFYVGLTEDNFYWEILIVNIRKISFILCSTVLSSLNAQLKLLHKRQPYQDPEFTKIEYHSQYAAILCLYGGMFFTDPDVNDNQQALLVLFLLILIYNLYFYSLWTYRFGEVLLRAHVYKLREYRCCYFLRRIQVDTYEMTLKKNQRKEFIKKLYRRKSIRDRFINIDNLSNSAANLKNIGLYKQDKDYEKLQKLNELFYENQGNNKSSNNKNSNESSIVTENFEAPLGHSKNKLETSKFQLLEREDDDRRNFSIKAFKRDKAKIEKKQNSNNLKRETTLKELKLTPLKLKNQVDLYIFGKLKKNQKRVQSGKPEQSKKIQKLDIKLSTLDINTSLQEQESNQFLSQKTEKEQPQKFNQEFIQAQRLNELKQKYKNYQKYSLTKELQLIDERYKVKELIENKSDTKLINITPVPLQHSKTVVKGQKSPSFNKEESIDIFNDSGNQKLEIPPHLKLDFTPEQIFDINVTKLSNDDEIPDQLSNSKTPEIIEELVSQRRKLSQDNGRKQSMDDFEIEPRPKIQRSRFFLQVEQIDNQEEESSIHEEDKSSSNNLTITIQQLNKQGTNSTMKEDSLKEQKLDFFNLPKKEEVKQDNSEKPNKIQNDGSMLNIVIDPLRGFKRQMKRLSSQMSFNSTRSLNEGEQEQKLDTNRSMVSQKSIKNNKPSSRPSHKQQQYGQNLTANRMGEMLLNRINSLNVSEKEHRKSSLNPNATLGLANNNDPNNRVKKQHIFRSKKLDMNSFKL
eukprot:403368259